jgi:hypothetical protein
MTKTRFPVDEHGTVPSAQDWEQAEGSLERHLATAASFYAHIPIKFGFQIRDSSSPNVWRAQLLKNTAPDLEAEAPAKNLWEFLHPFPPTAQIVTKVAYAFQ